MSNTEISQGLYNVLFGVNEYYKALITMLSLTTEEFGRFRDAYLNADGTKIIVLTRCGGDNRHDYKDVFAEILRHENYLQDYDDNIDATYCYFEFSVPDRYIEICKSMSTGVEPKTVSEKFHDHIVEMVGMTEEQIAAEFEKVLGSDGVQIIRVTNKKRGGK